MTTAKRTRRPAKLPKVITAEESTSITVKTKIDGEEGDDNEITREVHKFQTDPAYIRVGAGVTKNLGNFESMRVDVAITMPCYREMLDETYQLVAEKVATLLEDEIDEYLSDED